MHTPYTYSNNVLKFHWAVNDRFGEIAIYSEKNYHKKHFFGNKAKNKDKWMGIASDIEMVWYDWWFGQFSW